MMMRYQTFERPNGSNLLLLLHGEIDLVTKGVFLLNPNYVVFMFGLCVGTYVSLYRTRMKRECRQNATIMTWSGSTEMHKRKARDCN